MTPGSSTATTSSPKAADAAVVTIDELHEALRKIVVAGAFKDAAVSAAKKLIDDGSCHQVKLTARINATVTKGISEPPVSGESPATVNLFTRDIICDLFKRLGVTPAKLRRMLGVAQAAANTPDEKRAELVEAIATVEKQMAEKLPAQTWTRPGRAGAVRVEKPSVQILECSID